MQAQQHPLVKPRFSTVIIFFLTVVIVWIALYYVIPENSENAIPSVFAQNIESNFMLSPLLLVIISLLLTLLNAYLIYGLNNRFAIIRTRTFLPVFVYLLLMTVWFHSHYFVYEYFALTMLLLSIFVSFSMYHNRNAPEQAFAGTLILSIGSLLITPLVLFVPINWIIFVRYKCFSLRNFAASLIGLLLPWGFYFFISYYFLSDTLWVQQFTKPFLIDIEFAAHPTIEIVYITLLILLYIAGHCSMLRAMRNDSLQIRAKLDIIFYYGIAAFVFAIVFSGQHYVFLPFIAFSFSFLFSHPITLTYSKFTKLLFIVFTVLNLLYLAIRVYLENISS
ncbi:MAG: DUF6427 family protein [Paludibacter sp.]|jgi:hypothetical protein|nr:DUF6427 family protein [Paludibacter sp.]